ncbi:MAG: EamA family transporter, partial [Longimicrobiales bacterium]
MEAQLTPARTNESLPATAPIRASVALLAMVFIWGLNFSIAKGALAELTPLTFNALRFPLAAAVVYLALRSRGALPMPRPEDVWRILALGVLG